jgi:hypothetical protein
MRAVCSLARSSPAAHARARTLPAPVCKKPQISLYEATAYSMRYPHMICGRRIQYAVPAYKIRVPHTTWGCPHMICGFRIQYAGNIRVTSALCSQRTPAWGTAYNMRTTHERRRHRIQYAVTAYSMRSAHTVCAARILYAAPHTICGYRILYAVTAYCMRAPHYTCAFRI